MRPSILLISLSVLIIVTGCDRKEVNRRDHVTNDAEPRIVVQSTGETSQSDNEIYKQRSELFDVIRSQDSVKADEYLNLFFNSYITDFFKSENNLSSEVKSVVTDIINQLIFISSKRTEYSKELLDNVFYGCSGQLRGCVKYDYYPKTRSSVEMIIEDIKSHEFTAVDAARLLFVMQAYRGKPDPNLFLLIMENRPAINEFLESHSHLRSEGKSIVDLAIQQVKTNSQNSPEFKARYCGSALESDWVKELESPAKTYSEKQNTLEIITYCKDSIEAVNTVFFDRLKEEKTDQNSDSFLSLYAKKSTLMQSRYSAESDLINLAGEEAAVELFVVDRFFNEKIPLIAASHLIENFGGIDDLKFLKVINAYMKSYFSFKADAAFDALTEELGKSIKNSSGLSSSTLIDVTQNVSKRSYDEWADINKKFLSLEDLVNRLFAYKVSRSSFGDESRELYFSIKDKLSANNLNQTIKQNIEQPMQLFIAYFLSNLTGQAKFYFSWVSSIDKYYSVDMSNALTNYLGAFQNTILGMSSLFQFSSNPLLMNSPMKVQSTFYKAAKFGLFDRIPFSIPAIVAGEEAKFEDNVKLLFEQIFSKTQQTALNNNTSKLGDLERKFLDREKDGIKEIRQYCSDPFNAFVQQSFSNLNSRISMPQSSDELAPLAIKSLQDASNIDYWKNWKVQRDKLSDYMDLVVKARPEKKSELNAFMLDKFKKYEAPIIAIAKIKKELRQEIFGTDCFKKTVDIERFRLSFMFNEFDSYIKSLYLMAKTSQKVKDVEDLNKAEFDALIDEVAAGKNIALEQSELKSQVAVLFEDRGVKDYFGLSGRRARITSEKALTFLNLSVSHHNKDALGNKVGFKALGVPSDIESKNFNLANFVKVTGETLTFSKWDLYLKARHLMQTSDYNGESNSAWPESGKLFPNLLFDLGGQSQIEGLSVGNSTKKVAINLSINFEDFQKKIKREIFGLDQPNFFTWYKPDGQSSRGRPGYYSHAYKARLALYKSGPIPLTHDWAENCFDQASRSPVGTDLNFAGNKTNSLCSLDEVSGAEVLSEYTRYINYMKLSDRDLFVVEGLGSQSIYGEKLRSAIKVSGMRSQEWRWFDNLYHAEFVSEKLRAASGVSVSLDAIPHGREVSRFITEVEASLKKENHILFHDEIYKHLRDRIKSIHYAKVDRILDFENRVFELEQSTNLGDIPIEIALIEEEREVLVPSTDYFDDLDFGDLRVLRAPLLEAGSDAREYLSRSKGPLKWFWGNYNLFYNKQTSCFLLPEENDFDKSYYSNIDLESGSCRARARRFVDKVKESDRGFSGLFENL